MAFKKKDEMDYIPEPGAEKLFHISKNNRIHNEDKQEYNDNWVLLKFKEADFIDFCKNGGTFHKWFDNPVIKIKNEDGEMVKVEFSPKTAKECMKIFEVEGNERFVKLLYSPLDGKKKTAEPEETPVV